MKPLLRIAALHRELAEAYEDLAREQDATPVKKSRHDTEKRTEAARDAAAVVKLGLARRGIRTA